VAGEFIYGLVAVIHSQRIAPEPDMSLSVHPAPSNHRVTGHRTQNPIHKLFSGIDFRIITVLSLLSIWDFVFPFRRDNYRFSLSYLFA
jgi:hypothetical protein